MARSHLTLAALATSAVPDLIVAGSGVLSGSGDGDFDSALLLTNENNELVVRVPTSDRAASDLSVELAALEAMTDGIRSRLPFAVPAIVGHSTIHDKRFVVATYLPGYTVAAHDLPAGDGAATSIGAAIAAIHALPTAFVANVGLTQFTAAESRAEATAVVERASATGRLPAAVKQRWLDALHDDSTWQFQPTVIHGSVGSGSFLITDHAVGPVVTGVIGWSGLRVGDPAYDLHWISGAEVAAPSIVEAYRRACARPADSHIVRRALFYAELELARWLLHGVSLRDDAIVADAESMLDGLVDSVLGDGVEPLTEQTGPIMALGEVEALLGRTPATPPRTSSGYAMETDSYDREELTREFDTGSLPDRSTHSRSHLNVTPSGSPDDLETGPIDIPRTN